MINDTFVHQFIFYMEWAFYVVRIMYYLVILSFGILAIITIVALSLYFTQKRKRKKPR